MFKIISMCLLLLSVGCVSNTENVSSNKDKVGKFYLDLSEAEVKKYSECTVQHGKDQLWGADGLYHQDWNYKDCGLNLDMISNEQNASKVVGSINIVAPSKLTTNRGIGIGSSEKEVMEAYKERWNKGESRKDMFVVDSIFGGILLRIDDGKVTNIFVGAGAE